MEITVVHKRQHKQWVKLLIPSGDALPHQSRTTWTTKTTTLTHKLTQSCIWKQRIISLPETVDAAGFGSSLLIGTVLVTSGDAT